MQVGAGVWPLEISTTNRSGRIAMKRVDSHLATFPQSTYNYHQMVREMNATRQGIHYLWPGALPIHQRYDSVDAYKSSPVDARAAPAARRWYDLKIDADASMSHLFAERQPQMRSI